ncbi:hypothetical protein BC792_11674 [Sphingobacterium allocomposti]|uniref:Uncharacterized protein n=1 Tax=Sphingobacterium allocomposti TaxID=415956 RepID=A0A5S5DCR2_9SPHI|nr:hypothetical protein [Sphingobacterium composti Yoo et al. 2007 non Ten et al. 2007]TYP92472.1 hypothetical protein BC792_11674 [Sphingobacterium composti Yoo et al. 2007 non Ten et al. 2007]
MQSHISTDVPPKAEASAIYSLPGSASNAPISVHATRATAVSNSLSQPLNSDTADLVAFFSDKFLTWLSKKPNVTVIARFSNEVDPEGYHKTGRLTVSMEVVHP